MTARAAAATPSIVDVRKTRDHSLLRAFHDTLYLPAFPAVEHREEMDAWVRDLLGPTAEKSAPFRELLLAGTDLGDPDRRQLSGGHMFEYYPESSCGLLSYIVVAETARRNGLGRELVNAATAMLREAAAERGTELRAIYAECIDPREAPPDQQPEAWLRLAILGRFGARVLDVPYTAPALGPDRARARDLLLLSLPINPQQTPTLSRAVLLDFLGDFYRALGVADPKSDPDFTRTEQAATQDPVATVQLRQELPVFTLKTVSIALHFVHTRGAAPEAKRPSGLLPRLLQRRSPRKRVPKAQLPSDPFFNSLERDLVSYAYRGSPPFASEALRPERPLVTEVVFPPEADVVSEGNTITFYAAGQDDPGRGRRRRLRTLRSRTVFADGIVVDHLVLTNTERTDSELNEFDVVKLLKLHGGGEDSSVAKALRFSTSEREVTFPAWLRQIGGFKDEPILKKHHLRAATVLITTGEDSAFSAVYDNVCQLAEQPDVVAGRFRKLLAAEDEADRERGEQLKASEGIVCTLLNFGEIDHLELADALEPSLGSPDFLLWLQKANLVCLTKSDRITEVEACRRDIGASPYLLAPHAVLLHNEEVLRTAACHLDTLEGGETRQRLEYVRGEVVRALRESLLSNVFHYRTERMIFDAGERDRGLRERAQSLERRLTKLDSDIEARIHAGQVREEQALAVIFGVLAATALGDIVVMALSDAPRWHLGAHLGAIAAVALVIVLLVWRIGRR